MAAATDTLTRSDERTDTGNGQDPDKVAHYARKDQIVASAVEGSHVVTLCGEVLQATRDAKDFPVCQECKRLYDMMRKG